MNLFHILHDEVYRANIITKIWIFEWVIFVICIILITDIAWGLQ